MWAAGTPDHQTQARSEPPPPAGQPRQRWVVWVLLAILLFAIVTDLIFYMGFVASDDLTYSHGAIQIAESGSLRSIHPATIRLGIVLPLAVVARVTNQSMFAMTAFFVLFHLLVVVGTYWLGRLIHGIATGLLAAGFIAICPLASIFATMIFPDHAATALILFATGTVLVGARIRNASPRSKRADWALAGAGFLFGLSLTAKEAGIIMLPPLLALVVFSTPKLPARRRAASALAFLGGLAAASILYAATFRAATGLWSPFQDSAYAERMRGFPDRVQALTYPTAGDRLRRLVHFGTSAAYLGVFLRVVPVALVAYPLFRRRSWFVYLTFIWLCAYMTWGTFNLSRYSPPPMQIRYFILPLPFLMIMGAHIAASVGRWIWRLAAAATWRRHIFTAVAVLAGIAVVASCYRGLDRVSGAQFWSRELAGVRYAVDFACNGDGRPVVLSYWLSTRVGVALPGDASYLIASRSSTGIEDVMDLVGPEGFLYLESSYEQSPTRRGVSTLSPLDSAIRDALVGENPGLLVKTIGVFSEFKTRSAAFRYVYGGIGDGYGLRQDTRYIMLREVTFTPEELPDDERVVLDLSQPEVWAPTWTHRVETCDRSVLPDGSLECSIIGSDDASGGQYGGVRMRVGGIRAIQLEVSFSDPEQIGTVFVDLTAGPGPNRRLRWQSTPEYVASLTEGVQTLTFAMDRPTPGFSYVGGEVSLADVDHVQFFVRLRGLRARPGFRIHRVVFWPRSDGN